VYLFASFLTAGIFLFLIEQKYIWIYGFVVFFFSAQIFYFIFSKITICFLH
jgi:hypothetical protein